MVLDVEDDAVTIDADYVIENTSNAALGIGISYPILVAADRPAPKEVILDGKPLAVTDDVPGRVAVSFPLSLPEHAIKTFHIRYRQPALARQAVYLVTSALSWSHPIDRAVFEVRFPSRFTKVKLSYPVLDRREEGDHTILLSTLQPFTPDGEVVFRWSPEKKKHR